MAKRHLNVGIEEWDSLPWWHQRVYVEGMLEEFTEGQEETREGRVPTQVLDLDEDGPEALAAIGLSIQAV